MLKVHELPSYYCMTDIQIVQSDQQQTILTFLYFFYVGHTALTSIFKSTKCRTLEKEDVGYFNCAQMMEKSGSSCS